MNLLKAVAPLVCMALLVAVIAAIAIAVRRTMGRAAMNQSHIPGPTMSPLRRLAAVTLLVLLLVLLMHAGRGAGAVAGLSLGIAALVRIKRRGALGKGLAWAGIALLTLLLGLLLTELIVYTQLQGNLVTGHL